MPTVLEIVRDAVKVSALLEPQRARLLAMLAEPDSAAGLARRLELPRQQVNYHLRELERAALIRLVEERRKGNCIERLMQATALSYLISPDVAGTVPDPDQQDRYSSAWLAAAAARTLSELADMRVRADAAGKRLATLALTADIRFASPETRAAFAADITEAFATIVARYHDDTAENGRTFRVLFGAHPKPRSI
jgi:DNA-binding transcriptional ArsR family regulator